MDWYIEVAIGGGLCTDCSSEIGYGDDVWKGEGRILCTPCACLVLNAREDYIRDLEKERNRIQALGSSVEHLWKKAKDYIEAVEDEVHFKETLEKAMEL